MEKEHLRQVQATAAEAGAAARTEREAALARVEEAERRGGRTLLPYSSLP